MSLVSNIIIQNGAIVPSKLDTAAKYTISGLTANLVAIGSGAAGADPPRGCFDLTTSNSVTGWVESTSAGGRSTVIVKNTSSEWHLRAENDGVLYITTSANTGTVCMPGTLCVATVAAAAGASQWVSTNNCIYYNATNGNVGIGTTTPIENVRLTSSSAGPSIARFVNSSAAICTDIQAASASGFIGTTTNHGLQIGTNNTARICIDNSGLVCIPTAVTLGSTITNTGNHILINGSYVSCCLAAANGTLIGYQQFTGCDNGGATQLYGNIYSCIMSGAAGAECGTIVFSSTIAGTNTVKLRLDPSAVCVVGAFLATGAGSFNGDVCISNSMLRMICSASAPGTILGSLCFCGIDCASTAQVYAGIVGCVANGTAGVECGRLLFNITCCGSLNTRGYFHDKGLTIAPAAVANCGMFNVVSACNGGMGSEAFFQGSGSMSVYIDMWRADTNSTPMLFFRRSNSNADFTHGSVATGSLAGSITFNVSDGADYRQIAGICAISRATTASSTCHPGCMRFGIVCDNSTNIFTAFEIYSNGNVNFGGAVTVASNLCVLGTLGKAAGSFVISHPCSSKEEPNKYNAINLIHGFEEGPKYGIFYEGEDYLCDGIALVKLPEYFDKLVNRKDSIHIQLTNMGSWTPLVIMMNDNCKVCGNCFYVCTTNDGIKNAQFDWRLSATRGDKYVMFDNTQTDNDGKLIVEQWKAYDQIVEPQETFEAMTKEDLQSWLDYNNRTTYVDSEKKINNLDIIKVNTKKSFIEEIVQKNSEWDEVQENCVVVKKIRKANKRSKKILEEIEL